VGADRQGHLADDGGCYGNSWRHKTGMGEPSRPEDRTIGAKADNLFVAEFDFDQDMEWALGGSPWVVGKHTVVLRDYEDSLKPSEIRFDRMDIWVWIMDLPSGWMNQHQGARAMGLIGEVKKLNVDKMIKQVVRFCVVACPLNS
jgi:hypothetical protein